MSINPRNALYIKLGRRGLWERECIANHTLRLGYKEAPHSLCLEARWDEVEAALAERGYARAVARRHVIQIRHFYQSDDQVLWVTFHAGHLWWCFSGPTVSQLEDGTKTRLVIAQWSCRNQAGEPIELSQVSGRILMVQGFRGTICPVRDLDYLVRKINGEPPAGVEAAIATRAGLVHAIEKVIRTLHWRDFELLMDLAFRGAGWRRVSEVGGPQHTLDLVLVSPITDERYGVQIKSQASRAEYVSYAQQVGGAEGFTRAYFAVHSPASDLLEAESQSNVELLRPNEIAEWSVKYGLVDWIVDRAG